MVVALGDGGGGEDDRFEDVAAGADGADFGEVGAHQAAVSADAVAGGAGDLVAEEYFPAAGGVALFQQRFEFGEVGGLIFGMGAEDLDQVFDLRLVRARDGVEEAADFWSRGTPAGVDGFFEIGEEGVGGFGGDAARE